MRTTLASSLQLVMLLESPEELQKVSTSAWVPPSKTLIDVVWGVAWAPEFTKYPQVIQMQRQI